MVQMFLSAICGDGHGAVRIESGNVNQVLIFNRTVQQILSQESVIDTTRTEMKYKKNVFRRTWLSSGDFVFM
jgi:hypothetical protein